MDRTFFVPEEYTIYGTKTNQLIYLAPEKKQAHTKIFHLTWFYGGESINDENWMI